MWTKGAVLALAAIGAFAADQSHDPGASAAVQSHSSAASAAVQSHSSAANAAVQARGSAASAAVQAIDDPTTIADTLVLYYVGHAIGRERYELATTPEGRVLTADFDYRDRGRRTHVTSTLRTAADFTPQRLEIARLTDTSATVETRVEVRGRDAAVLARGDSTRVTLPARAFVIAGTTPTTQHYALLRYWLAHGEPATVSVVPGGPINEVTIQRRGRDTLDLNGTAVVLDRFAVNGVVWGRESVWLDARGRLAAYTTAGGGGLTLESVRQELAPLYPKLIAIATRDRLADLAALSQRARPTATGSVALVGATLVDGTGRDAVRDATVIVADGRIVAAGPSASVTIPATARRVDVRGKTIVPGLWDMHGHVMQIEWAPTYLATGVTTVRDMGNEIDFVIPLREAIRSGRVIGPNLLLAGLVDGPGPDAFGAVTAGTPDEARAVARRYHDLGFEQLKLYTLLSPAVVGALTAEAHRLGMTVTGHVPAALSVTAAADSGMDHIAHMPIRGEPGSDSVARVIAHLVSRGTAIDPTASWGELLGHSTLEPVTSFQPGVVHLPPAIAQRIGGMGARGIDTATAHARLGRTLRMLGALHAAGVPLLAGTDEGVPGFSVAREIELYVAAGMTPMDALRAATAVSAKAMGLERETGTVEAGKRADLLILDANPLDAISNIRRMAFVMKGGALYAKADLWRAADFR
jgi:imidazolonepropionase-like amidohydrolase